METDKQDSLDQALAVLQSRLSPQAFGSVKKLIEEDLLQPKKDKSTAKENQHRAEYWWSIIDGKGGSELYGKARPDQLELGNIKPVDPQDYNYKKLPNRHEYCGYASFDPHGIGFTKENSTRAIHDFLTAVNIARDFQDTNQFLLIYQSPEEGEITMFGYTCKSHRDVTPAAGGGNINLSFNFFLPSEDAKRLIAEIEKNPELIEEIFLDKYSKLVKSPNGLARVKTDKLVITKNVPKGFNEWVNRNQGYKESEDAKRKQRNFVEDNSEEFETDLGEMAA